MPARIDRLSIVPGGRDDLREHCGTIGTHGDAGRGAVARRLCRAARGAREPIVWSNEWFDCDGRFQCIIVYDAWCTFTAVNAEHARTYEFWASEEARRLDEKVPCPPAAGQPAPLPVCREGRCDVL